MTEMLEPEQEPPSDEPELRRALEDLEEILARVPGATRLAADLKIVRSLLLDRRPPRLVAFGRRGSGKSSLANALLSFPSLQVGAVSDTTKEPSWVTLKPDGRVLRWLDTPGFRAGGIQGRPEALGKLLRLEPPDVLLWTVRPQHVDSGLLEDLADLKALLGGLAKSKATLPALLPVLTRCDELPPLRSRVPPYPSEKLKLIDEARTLLIGQLEQHHVAFKPVLATAAYQRFLEDGTLVVDWRWNISKLAEQVFEALPQEAQTEAARAFTLATGLRRKVARRIVGALTSVAFLVGATPLPVADLFVLAPLQVLLVTGLMVLSGRKADFKTAAEWLAGLGVNVGAGVALREAARALVKLIPGMGGAISGAVAAAGTWAIGQSAIRYFLEGGTVDEARRVFEQARARAHALSQTPGGLESLRQTDDTDETESDHRPKS